MWAAIIGAVVGLGASYMGAQSAAGASKDVAKVQRDIQRQNIEFQMDMQKDALTALKPYRDLAVGIDGRSGALGRAEAISTGQPYDRDALNKLEGGLTSGGLTMRMNELGRLNSGSSGVYANLMNKTNADATERQYAREVARIKLGSGAATSAGQEIVHYGNVVADAEAKASNAAVQARLDANSEMQGFGLYAADKLSGLPAYMKYRNYNRKPSGPTQAEIEGTKAINNMNWEGY